MAIYRTIWEESFGPIPKDSDGRSYEIHHIDGDHNNNSLDNLKCVSIKEHFEIHLKQEDYNACLLILERMSLSPKEISNKQKEIAHIQLQKGTHNFSKPEFQKRNAVRRVQDGTHHWLGKSNPSHKRVENGTHNFQLAKKKKCEHCGKEVDVANYALRHGDYCFKYTGLKSPGVISLEGKAGKNVKGTIWITNSTENKRIRKDSIIPADWKKGKKSVPLRIVKCPHCSKEGGISQMKQWHFDNCKHKDTK
jgi:hypothetical protein